MTPIRTIILDLGGVYFTDGSEKFMKNLSQEHSIPIEDVYEVIKGDLGKKYRSGNLPADAFWEMAKSAWNIREENTVLSRKWAECYEPINTTAALVRELRKGGYRVIFLSNNVVERIAYLESRYRFMSEFDGGVLSYNVGANKPDVKIYAAALEKTECSPSECVFIDDKKVFLAPAEALGMKTLLFQGSERLEGDLRRLGLSF